MSNITPIHEAIVNKLSELVPIIGKICMDGFMCDVTDINNVD